MLVSASVAAWAVFICTLAAASAGYFIFRPRNWEKSPTDVLILVAHQDDCVVLAGEYALWALSAGKTVRIVYLTCGADAPESPQAKMRNQEAISVWDSVGVPATALHFLGYRQSPLNGTTVLSQAEQRAATTRITALIREAEPGTAVFMPAAGESHADHREIRRIALKALNDSERQDLVVLEAPEYNPYLSWIRSPAKAFQYLLKSTPIVRRFARSVQRSVFPGFVSGGRACRLSDAGSVYQKKIEMLRGFVSEDGELLVRHFGWRSQFRPVSLQEFPLDERLNDNYFRIGERWLGASIIGSWLSIYFLLGCVSWRVAQGFQEFFPGLPGTLPIFASACGSCFAAIRGRKHLESCLLYVSVGLGLTISVYLVLID